MSGHDSSTESTGSAALMICVKDTDILLKLTHLRTRNGARRCCQSGAPWPTVVTKQAGVPSRQLFGCGLSPSSARRRSCIKLGESRLSG